MKKLIFLLGIALSLGNAIAQQAYNVRSPYDPATQKVAEELQGEVIKFTLSDSQLYPGTQREVLVYVPQQYDGTKPACLLVCMDGILYDATTVMDNLIASGEMPVTIGVFVNPGVVYDEDGEVVRYNRCKEFDSTDDTFSNFVENEVLTKVEGMKTPSGKVVLRRSYTSGKLGSYAAVTSALRHLLADLTTASFLPSERAISARMSINTSHCIPVCPSEPTSSLSARTTITVCASSLLSKSAVSAGYAQTRSSWP